MQSPKTRILGVGLKTDFGKKAYPEIVSAMDQKLGQGEAYRSLRGENWKNGVKISESTADFRPTFPMGSLTALQIWKLFVTQLALIRKQHTRHLHRNSIFWVYKLLSSASFTPVNRKPDTRRHRPTTSSFRPDMG
jgi:hypothetical protein